MSLGELRIVIATRLLEHVFPVALELRARTDLDWHAFLKGHPAITSGHMAMAAQLWGLGLNVEGAIDGIMAAIGPPPEANESPW